MCGNEENMKWIKLTLKTTTKAVDLISNLLEELGVEGIEIEDKIPLTEEEKKEMFIDILPELPPDDGTAFVSSYIEPEKNIDELVKQIKEGLEELQLFVDIGEGTITIEEKDDADWINNWKAFFKPFRVGEHIVIKPTWETIEQVDKEDLVIEIDPGTAFGTGSHETTKLCIEQLCRHVNRDTVLLDIGCGSGILSIIGLKLGARYVVGTDIDKNALQVTCENMEVNHIKKEQFQVFWGNLIEDRTLQQQVGLEQYDIVVANILADVIIPLCQEVGQHMKQGGLFFSSGIFYTKREEVREALLQNNFDIIQETTLGDWTCFSAKIQK